MITFFEFLDGTRYCLARDIIDTAREHGYSPTISTDGRVHPGTICNKLMRRIIKDPGLRRKFNITPSSVIELRMYQEGGGDYFIQRLIREQYIVANMAARGIIDFYSKEAAEAILATLLNADKAEIPMDTIYNVNYYVKKHDKSLEKGRLKPKASLF